MTQPPPPSQPASTRFRGRFWGGITIGLAVGIFAGVPSTLVLLGRSDSNPYLLALIAIPFALIAVPGALLRREEDPRKQAMGKGMLISIPIAVVLVFAIVIVIVVAALNAAFG